jgi:hypothetical protein
MTTEKIDVPPDVARISDGLRDTGYDFNTAVADIIDNSIAAEATTVDVRIDADFAGNLIVSVADNGFGMDREGLINAMRYGSVRRANAKSLGKFGLGLKTASTAFCKRLSVVSRLADSAIQPLRATWDLDKMAKTNTWSLELGPPDPSEIELMDEVASGESSTLVLWENVDRLLEGFADKSGRPFRRALDKLESRLRDHVGLVYQRFLDPNDDRERTLAIKINRVTVEPWDPFAIVETKAPVAEQVVPVQTASGKESSFTIRAFILPRKEEFSTPEARDQAKISNERQGVYVYRENRLIHGPDWMGMYKQEPHYSLFRVELSFDHELDDAFQVDIKKSRIMLDESMFEFLRDKFLAGPRREAELRYRRGAAGVATGAAALIHGAASNVIQQKSGGLSRATLSIVNAGTGQVEVTNKSGSTTAVLRIVGQSDTGALHVTTADTLEHGVLWEPTLGKGGAPAVALNTGHPFYVKAYLPNKTNSAVVQALDYLLWALANAELDNINDDTKDAFEEFRIEVSRNLKKLVSDLPDPIETTDG